MDVQERAGETAMAGKRRDLMDVPAGSGEIRQTQMTEGVRRETDDSRDARDVGDRFRPRPNAQGAPGISVRNRQEERTTCPADRSSLVQVQSVQLRGRCRVRDDSFTSIFRVLSAYPDQPMGGI